MTDPAEILRRTHRVLLHDWPSRDVPDSLTRAGFDVTVWGGPEPDDVYRHELIDGDVKSRKTGVPPEAADLVYVFRPIEDLPHILAEAKRIGATAVWRQSARDDAGNHSPRACAPTDDSPQWRSTVEAAGFDYVEDAYIGDIARQVSAPD